jgi:hypothetical protein
MKYADATNLDRKSGVARWRDLRFLFQFSRRLLGPNVCPQRRAESPEPSVSEAEAFSAPNGPL